MTTARPGLRRYRPAVAKALWILSIVGLSVSTLTLLIGLPALFRRGGGAHQVMFTAGSLLWTVKLHIIWRSGPW